MASGALVAHVTSNEHVFVGEDRTIQFDITNGTTPVNMTGYTLLWELRDKDDDSVKVSKANAVITLSNGSGTNDRATFNLARADTLSLPGATYYHTLIRVTSGSYHYLAVGNFELLETI